VLFGGGGGGGGGGTGPGGFIDDPAAMNGVGDIAGQGLVPRVNTVAAMPAGNAPFYTGDGFLAEQSDVGPGELLFDSSGNRLPAPVDAEKPNFVGPDGTNMSPDLTDRGERPVEALRPGDRVVASKALRRVRWIGRSRVTLSGHPERDGVLPVRLVAGALAPGQPHRDLVVSPHHAILVDEALVPAYRLLNGATVRREYGCTAVDYHHIELDSHDLLLAEGVRAESYLDTGNRGLFDQGLSFALLPTPLVAPAIPSC